MLGIICIYIYTTDLLVHNGSVPFMNKPIVYKAVHDSIRFLVIRRDYHLHLPAFARSEAKKSRKQIRENLPTPLVR